VDREEGSRRVSGENKKKPLLDGSVANITILLTNETSGNTSVV
jgi:hypothetical protein